MATLLWFWSFGRRRWEQPHIRRVLGGHHGFEDLVVLCETLHADYLTSHRHMLYDKKKNHPRDRFADWFHAVVGKFRVAGEKLRTCCLL